MGRRSKRREAPAASTALVPVEPCKNLPAEHRGLVATVQNDITIPYYNAVLQPQDDTLLQRGGTLGLKIYDQVERDTHAYSVLAKRKHELTAREWEIEPATPEAIDADVAKFLTDVCQSLPFDQICFDFLDANLKGFSVGEAVWGRSGAWIVPEAVVSHDQRRFVFDADWRLRLLTLPNMLEGIELPDRKFIVHRVGVKGNNPYGLGLGSRLFWAVLFKREGIAFWMTFLEKYASPTPVGKIPVGTAPDVQAKVLRSLQAFAQSRGITVPTGTELELLEAKRSGGASYETWARYWDEQMSVCVLGETLSTVMGSVGSLAAAEVHSEGKAQLIDADADLLSDTLQRTLFRWLVDYNFPGRPVPRLKRLRRKNQEAEGKAREQTAKAEVAEVAALNKALDLASGLNPQLALSMVRLTSSLAAKMEDAQLKALLAKPRPRTPAEPKPGKTPATGESEEPEPAFAFAAPAGVLGKAHLPLSIYDAFVAALEAPVAAWMKKVRAELAGAETLEAVKDRIDGLEAKLPLDKVAARLSDALVFASLLGHASVVVEAEEDGAVTAALFADTETIVFEGAPMDEAIEFLKQKVAMGTQTWRDVVREGHDRAFVVAGEMRRDVVADIQGMVVRNLVKGGIEGFRADFDKLLASGKWTGDPDLLKDEAKRAWRTKIIYMTNLTDAHAAGRMKQQLAMVDVLPFWQYRHGATGAPKRPREPHVRLDGLTLPASDPVWGKIYAPNGFRCSCAIRAITAAAAGRVSVEKRDAPLQHEIDLAVDPEWQCAPGTTWERERK